MAMDIEKYTPEYLSESEYVFNELKTQLTGFDADPLHAEMMEPYGPGQYCDLADKNNQRQYWSDLQSLTKYISNKLVEEEINSEVTGFFEVLDAFLVSASGVRRVVLRDEVIQHFVSANFIGDKDAGQYRKLLASEKSKGFWDKQVAAFDMKMGKLDKEISIFSPEYAREAEPVFNELMKTLPGFKGSSYEASMMNYYAPGELYDLSLPDAQRHCWLDVIELTRYVKEKIEDGKIDSEVKNFFKKLDYLLLNSEEAIPKEFLVKEVIGSLLNAYDVKKFDKIVREYKGLFTSKEALKCWNSKAREIRAKKYS